ncbi:MAG: DUF4350 domain-containing protein [Pyrinomonadaceae bacterium]
MRQRLFIFGAIALVVLALLAINAVSYVQISQPIDTEANPDRSTYNAGPTGTRALYDFLQESGHRVMRWQEPTSGLVGLAGATRPSVWVIVGSIRKEFSAEEVSDLLEWVARGGRLVLIDRYPPEELLPPSKDWRFEVRPATAFPGSDTANDPTSLTAGVKPAKPMQPTLLVHDVASVQTSRFASSVAFFRKDAGSTTSTVGTDEADRDAEYPEENEDKLPAGPVVVDDGPPSSTVAIVAPAPVVHLTNNGLTLLLDYPHGAGRIVVFTDPYSVANAGLTAADNLLLARNLVSAKDGLIAFDEYHQGRAASQNHLAAYFAGTPVLPILAQLAFIVIAVMWTRSRRFAHALPLVQPDRRSKLEYVASMAELQQRSRAYDLAIENIYLRTRRVLARYAGVDGNSTRATIAERIAARSKLDQHQIETVMRQCEDAINGEPTNAKQALSLIARLREIENALGLRLRQREVKQSRER